MTGARLPLLAVTMALAGSVSATLWLHARAAEAAARALEERLDGAGRSAALWLAERPAAPDELVALMRAEDLEGALVVGADRVVLADATGSAGHPVNLLRVDAERLAKALAGEASVGFAYAVGGTRVGAGYFPLRAEPGGPGRVLVLEAGQEFTALAATIDRAWWAALGLSLLGALAVGAVALAWSRAERERRLVDARAARAEALAKVASAAAHEVRNPLGIIRGTVERLVARAGASLSARDQEALADILGETERLKRLTDDLMDLSADRPLALGEVDVAALAAEVAKASEAARPGVRVAVTAVAEAKAQGDGARLRQVLLNLCLNAAEANPGGEVRVKVADDGGQLTVRVEDDGPGLAPEVRDRLFEPFVTGKATGTGLGLAVSKRIVERHGGALRHVPGAKGTAFELSLPMGGARATG